MFKRDSVSTTMEKLDLQKALGHGLWFLLKVRIVGKKPGNVKYFSKADLVRRLLRDIG
jgi:hypothetical protein